MDQILGMRAEATLWTRTHHLVVTDRAAHVALVFLPLMFLASRPDDAVQHHLRFSASQYLTVALHLSIDPANISF